MNASRKTAVLPAAPESDEVRDRQNMASIVKMLLARDRLTPSEFLEMAPVCSRATFYSRLNAVKDFDASEIRRMARFFGVSEALFFADPDEVLGGRDQRSGNTTCNADDPTEPGGIVIPFTLRAAA